MLSIQTISSAVTAATVSIFILIVKNLNEKNVSDFDEEQLNEALSSAILAELETDSARNAAENEIDYELLEEKFKIFDNPENFVLQEGEFEDEKAGNGGEVKILESTSGTSLIEPQVDLTIEATHNLKNSGQHRPYTLSLHFTPRPRGEREPPIPWTRCKLNMEWPLPKNVFVDVWALRRLTPFTIDHYPSHVLNPSSIIAGLPIWSVKPRHPDLEVGSYDSKARPFILTAEIPFRIDGESSISSRIEGGKLVHSDAPWNLDLHVPDLVIRYQPAARGSLLQQHPNRVAYLPAPNLHFKCARPDTDDLHDLHVDWQLNRLRPLQISLPIGSATPLVGHVTMTSIFLSSLFLLITLFKF